MPAAVAPVSSWDSGARSPPTIGSSRPGSGIEGRLVLDGVLPIPTPARGALRLRRLLPGAHVLDCLHDGYQKRATFRIDPGHTTRVDLTTLSIHPVHDFIDEKTPIRDREPPK